MGTAQQTSYSLQPSGTGKQGQLVDSRDIVIDARRNDLAASAEAAFGLGVCKSTNSDDLGFGLCNASRQFLGILVHSMDFEKTVTGLPNGEYGNIMKKGRAWVKVVEDVTTASVVKIFIADYSGTITDAVEGAFGDTAVAAKTATLPNARYLRAGSAGDIIELELDATPVVLTADS